MKITTLIQQLIAISSVSGQEQNIINFIDKKLTTMGLSTKRVKGNLVCCIKGLNQKKSLIFNAHVDTVSSGDEKMWKYPPLAGKAVNNKVYGLGASDEKAGVASLILLAQELMKHKPACDVWFHFVINEEIDGSGTKQTMNWFIQKYGNKYSVMAGVLVEPTSLNTIEIGHKGNAFIKLEVKGGSGHGSEPDKVKANSVLVMSKALIALQKLSKQWAKKYHDPILGIPTIGIGTSISAGSEKSPNKFADICTATIDVRTVPEMHEKVLKLIKSELRPFSINASYLFEPAPYGFTEKSATIVQAFRTLLPELIVETSKGSTDQCFFTHYDIPAIIFGPGEKTCMHILNEYCYPKKVDKAKDIFQQAIFTWTSQAQINY